MSIVCKQLVCDLNRFLSCCTPTMVMSPFKTGRPTSNPKQLSTLPSIIREVEGDLFSAKRDTSLAHCVSSDMKMGAGIAVYFRLKFGRVDDLLSQKKSVGDVAYLKDNQRFIFYLVTKNRYFDKPTDKTLHCSLLKMKEKCMKFGVTKLAMPRIGCGLDGLKWPLVFHLVQEVFENCGMEITIYTIPDIKRKSMTPNLNRTRENFRNFFEPRRPHSLPAIAMNSKRKFQTDSLEEDFDTPKRRKVMNFSYHDKNVLVDVENGVQSPAMRKSSSDKKFEKKSSMGQTNSGLEYDTQTYEPMEALSTFSGDCPFLSSTKKRYSLPISKNNSSFNAYEYESPKPPAIPFLCEEDQDENPDLDTECAENSDKISARKSKDCHYSTSGKEGRKIYFSSSDRDEEMSEENSPECNRTKSESCSPERKTIQLKSPPSSLRREKTLVSSKSHSGERVKKEKRRSSSKSRSEERRKKEKRRSKSHSEEKHKKEKRRSSSKSQSEIKHKKEKRRSSSKSHSEEKVKKEKRRSSSKSHSEEKVKKEKRRSSSKSHSEEKLKKEKHRHSDSLTRESLDSLPRGRSQTKVNLVSERFPSFNKKRPSRDLSSSSDESVDVKPKCVDSIYQREDINHSHTRSALEPSSDDEHIHEIEGTLERRHVSPKEFNSRRPSQQPSRSARKKREGETTLCEDSDNSFTRKAKKTPDKQHINSPKQSKRTFKSPIGKLYSDSETPVSVKSRLSL